MKKSAKMLRRRKVTVLAVVVALTLVASPALAKKKAPSFLLNVADQAVTAVSGLKGNLAGPIMKLENDGTSSGATAMDLRVGSGQPPMSVNSDVKVDNLNADELDGKDSTEFLGVNDKAADSDKLDGKDSSEFAGAYKRTVVVSPVGSATDNGAALTNALNGITDASATNPYLLKIEPGVYDLGSSSLNMKPWVDIEGSGEGVTTLTSTRGGFTGAVFGASNTELRFLTVKNTGGSINGAVAIRSAVNPFRLIHVTATGASGGGSNFGVAIDGGVATLDEVTATGSSGNINYGVANYSGNTQIRNSRIVGGTYTIYSSSGTVRVGASQLDGGAVGSSSVTCAGVYDENYTFYPNTCP